MICRPGRWARRPVEALLVALLCCNPGRVDAQQVSAATVKAAFLTNFVKFAEWPNGSVPAGRGFTFCVVGDEEVFQALELTLKDRPPRDGARVAEVKPEGPFSGCQLLYLAAVEDGKWRGAIGALENAAVFTVSDSRGFAAQGGIAELKLEGGKMRFNINPGAAQRAGIALSAKLLTLATIVTEKTHEAR